MVDLAVARVCATLLAAIATTASADSGPRPQQGAQAQGVASGLRPAGVAAMTLRQACEKEIGKDLGAGHASCKVTKDDCDILDEIDANTDKGFEQRIDEHVLSLLPLNLQPMGGVLATANFKNYCDQEHCEVPVQVVPKAGSMNRCVAILPFHRYCILPVGGNKAKKPQTITFFLAEVSGGNYVRRAQKDFQFIKAGESVPKPYDQDKVVGLDVHEDISAGKRRPMKSPYLAHGTRAPDGQSFTWQVTASTVNTAGSKIGRIQGGVLSAAFVRPAGTTSVNDVCRPRDPIIVNTAN
ncbi:MAG: hypothetical protein H6933_08710 [Burkholderiaceae bacterium]|nr:hypothetical protein [Rhodoferax sp.]MCP5284967.1 hypothetical protein [Burkholderiaceae bacterium]